MQIDAGLEFAAGRWEFEVVLGGTPGLLVQEFTQGILDQGGDAATGAGGVVLDLFHEVIGNDEGGLHTVLPYHTYGNMSTSPENKER